MSNPGEADATPIASVRDLAAYLEAGAKPAGAFRIGTEHEKFGFYRSGHAPPPYQPGGIRAMLEGLAERGFAPILDGGGPIGLRREGESVSLEPGGQFELSGAPLETLHETADELERHFAEVRAVAAPLGLGFAPLGFHPLARREDMPWMPKGRYAVMRRYMPRVGGRGLDMMLRTCTVQVNLDFASEADMVRKFRLSLALQPLATALFANSPFVEGKPTGLMSNRAAVWTDTDPDRTGIPRFVFEDGFGFARYVEWALDVPMYFVYRRGAWHDVAGASFRTFMERGLAALPGERATVGDFADHLTTIFTDVRLKRFLEMRGADAGSGPMMLAQSAFWVGLLYDEAALAAAEELVLGMGWESLAALRLAVPRAGLAAPWRAGTLRDLARRAVAIAAAGLRARARRNAAGADETVFLAPLAEIAAGAPTQAERWLDRYRGPWGGDAAPIFEEAAI